MKDYNNCYGMPNEETMKKENVNLASMVSADKKYPVTYTIKQYGTKVYENTWLLGKDLTENQIKQLVHFNMPYPEIENPDVTHLQKLIENKEAYIETLENKNEKRYKDIIYFVMGCITGKHSINYSKKEIKETFGAIYKKLKEII